ncbi:hypothetical protein OPIT5_00210 (plasmid) [Opitutaceae bacterium TAV5]|nr:hypothetical protein OPIT5_00210 [Opitutaceae bacterium TAV5]
MLYGNPPFAEIITNDPGRASEIRRRLAIVKDADAIKAEITALTDKKENLLAQIALRETELNKARLDLGRLRQLIDQTIDTLKTAQTSMEEGTKSE